MADESIAPYVSGSIDAGKELSALGLPIARYFMRFMQRIAAGQRRYERDAPMFTGASGLPVYKADHANCFIAYVVEREADGAVLVTLLYADRLATFASTPQLSPQWDQAASRRAHSFIEQRLEDYIR